MSGPVLTSRFMAVLDHNELVKKGGPSVLLIVGRAVNWSAFGIISDQNFDET